MSAWLRRTFAATAGLCLFAVARIAGADDAAELVRRGVELRREHRSAEALEQFEKAVALSPSASVRAQLALCEQALGRWVDAERDLDAALAGSRDPWIAKHGPELERARAVLQDHLAWLTVDVDVPTSVVRVDGQAIPRATEVRVAAGASRLEVTAPDHAPDTRPIDLAPETHAHMAITLVRLSSSAPRGVAPAAPALAPQGPSPPGPPAPSEAPTPVDRPSLVGPAALAAAGGVALVLGAYFGVETFHLKSERDAACAGGCNPPALKFDSDARTDATVSTVAFGAGFALAAGGAAWWLALRARAARPASGSMDVAPLVGGRYGVAVQGRFW
jgi:hypothetical protein